MSVCTCWDDYSSDRGLTFCEDAAAVAKISKNSRVVHLCDSVRPFYGRRYNSPFQQIKKLSRLFVCLLIYLVFQKVTKEPKTFEKFEDWW